MTDVLPMGKLLITPAATYLAQKGVDVHTLLKRHLSGDWGDIDEDDRTENQLAIELGERVCSSYNTDHGRIWIITARDRSATPILTPDDY